ncbi:MAG: hypothetical protein IJ686_00655 [Bacteroidales bacterium]|nr:hypothetical protein [Bacteroidales bacterium]
MGELIMKTLKLFFAAALAIVAVSCEKESAPVRNGGEPETVPSEGTFFAEFGEKAGRVTMDNSYALSWEAGDQVSIYKVGASEASVYTAETAGTSTRLSGGEAVDENATYYAVYPASAAVSFDSESSVSAEIPATQALAPGQLPVNVAVAKTTGAEAKLSFRNVGALLQFTLGTSDVARVCVSANDGSAVAGVVIVAVIAAPTYSVAKEYKTLGLTPASGETFAAGTYYAAILPKTYTGGLNIKLFNAAGEQLSLSQSADQPILRSTRLPVGTIDAGTFTLNRTIHDAAEFANFLSVADTDYETWTIANDIDLDGVVLPSAPSFAGTLEGGNHTLDNLSLTSPLFTTLSGTVQNLKIGAGSKLEIPETAANYGFIAGENSGTITACQTEGRITAKETFVSPVASTNTSMNIGAVAGLNNGTITAVSNTASIEVTSPSISKYAPVSLGGIVGYLDGDGVLGSADTDDDIVNTGDILFTPSGISSNSFVGGICGQRPNNVSATIGRCKNSGKVSWSITSGGSSQQVSVKLGGVIGFSYASLTNCVNEGAVTLTTRTDIALSHALRNAAIGGVAGAAYLNIESCSNSGALTVEGTFGNPSSGTTDNLYIGGVAGYTSGSSNVYNSNVNSGTIGTQTVMNEATSEHTINGYFGGVLGVAAGVPTSCSNTAALSIASNLTVSRFGGLFGSSSKVVTTCDNTGALTFDYINTEAIGNQASQAYIGGLIGEQTANTVDQCNLGTKNNGITVLNGYPSATPSYIGGLIGKSGGIIQGKTTTTSNASSRSTNSKAITVSGHIYAMIGGVVGGVDKTLSWVANGGTITVSNPAPGTRVGGIAGTRSGANMQMSQSNGNITVSCEGVDDVAVGGMYGELTTAQTIHSSLVKTVINATGATAGLAVGKATAKVTLAANSSAKYNIPGSPETKVRYFRIKATSSVNGTVMTESNCTDTSLLVGSGDCTIATDGNGDSMVKFAE